MRSDIRNIKRICKFGAHGNPNAMGFWIYGKRKDGRTVACKNEPRVGGGITIWSEYSDDSPYMIENITEFSEEEWEMISSADKFDQKRVGNKILDARKP